ncbi:hypothetical protein [Cupriavidus sp. CuC1]|uniref:hypothetical protein n=1 Tax=Cupriavidus sp. CuC1 TaxID=3373131 RepID=UPI0037D5EC35
MTRLFAYRGFEVMAFAQQSFTTLWVATYDAYPSTESELEGADDMLYCRFLCDGRKHRLVDSAEEATEQAAEVARAAIDTKLFIASLRKA